MWSSDMYRSQDEDLKSWFGRKVKCSACLPIGCSRLKRSELQRVESSLHAEGTGIMTY